MSVFRSADLDADIRAWDKAQQDWEDGLLHCESCGQPLDDYMWEIDGEILCEDCAREKYRRRAEVVER